MRAAIQIGTLFLLTSTVARATPIPVDLNTSQSSVTVTMTLTLSGITRTSSDTSAVAGTITVKPAPLSPPTSIALYDMHMNLLSTIDLVLNYGILGTIQIHSQTPPNEIRIDYAPTPPGTPRPPVPVSGSAFNDATVPTLTSGLVNYSISTTLCSIIHVTYPTFACSGTNDLSSNGVQNGPFSGTVTVSPARVLTLVSNINQSTPLDPTNPALGSLNIVGTVRGSVTVPKRGDANLDGTVDARDIGPFVQVLLNPTAATWQKRFATDMNDDDAFTAADATSLANCLLGNGCPN